MTCVVIKIWWRQGGGAAARSANACIRHWDDNADAKRILLVPLRQTGEDNQVVPASRDSAPSNRIWNDTTSRSAKQQIWLRTALSGGCYRRMSLCNRADSGSVSHGSNGSTDPDGSHGSWVSIRDPLTHERIFNRSYFCCLRKIR